ncbi:aldehyde dehydrogenase family protein [Collimonas pratensis]|uniref:Aldehyde dehydrogenase family protein n=1 Tax=Collimonas pratensis TaxID=279113 RepID=A0ABM5Z7F9_9BURK|nr:aldehyde dehydrogenase family protein [Collimonas pratensis]AMP14934.1 aldehyde dehydrogenase family protein [Collimonas pratensis]
MKTVDHIYINGSFVKPHGKEVLELVNPSTGAPIARVTLADEQDAQAAIAAAKAAYPSFSRSSKEQRMTYLQRLHDAVAARSEELLEVMIEEYGGPLRISKASTQRAAVSLLHPLYPSDRTHQRHAGTFHVPGATRKEESSDRQPDLALRTRQLCAVRDRHAGFRSGFGNLACRALSGHQDYPGSQGNRSPDH